MIGDNPSMAPGRIRLLLSSKTDEIQQKFDIVLNVDSITEMSSDVAAIYVTWIAKSSCRSTMRRTLSPWPNLASAHLPPGAKTARSPYYMRQGYVEEISATHPELAAASSDDDAGVTAAASVQ
jgi:hypothetical protein